MATSRATDEQVTAVGEAYRALETWMRKPHSVEIYHDNSFGAHCGWSVKLYRGGTLLVEVTECDDEFLDADGDITWPGLGAVMSSAVRRVQAADDSSSNHTEKKP